MRTLRRLIAIMPTTIPQAQGASGERLRHADLGGVRLLPGLFNRLNLFAFAVPVFPGKLFAVFEGSFFPLLAVLVPAPCTPTYPGP